jgi:hypothetical protein
VPTQLTGLKLYFDLQLSPPNHRSVKAANPRLSQAGRSDPGGDGCEAGNHPASYAQIESNLGSTSVERLYTILRLLDVELNFSPRASPAGTGHDDRVNWPATGTAAGE